MTKYKIAFFTFWLVILSLGPFIVLKDITPLFGHKNFYTIFNILQRISGLVVFSLLFFQVLLSSFADKLKHKLGGWITNFLIFQEVVIFLLFAVYQVSFMLTIYFIGHGLDLFYVFTDFCVLCSNRYEFMYDIARIAFWLLLVPVVVWFFQDSSKWLKTNWKNFRNLNYLSFFMIAAVLFYPGSDYYKMPFVVFYVAALITVFGVGAYKLFTYAKSSKLK